MALSSRDTLVGPPATAPSPAPGFVLAVPRATPRRGPRVRRPSRRRRSARACSFSAARGFQHRSFPQLGREGGLIFDLEDGCWLPAGLDSDTFPIFADRSLVRGAVPFGRHVSRRARQGGERGPGDAAGAGGWGRFPSRGAFLPVGVGSERLASGARIWRGRVSRLSARLEAGMRSELASPDPERGQAPGAELSREMLAADSWRLSPSLKGF